MGGKIYTPLGAWYHATKHALEGWSDCLRLELKQFGIAVVVIEPGIIETEFGSVLMDPMLEISGNGPYKNLAQKIANSVKSSYEKGVGSSPSVIAKLVSKVVKSNKPKTRYAIKELEKELNRKDKALAEMAALVALKKKLHHILEDSEDD
jgi:short-subunit dehydrogenase